MIDKLINYVSDIVFEFKMKGLNDKVTSSSKEMLTFLLYLVLN